MQFLGKIATVLIILLLIGCASNPWVVQGVSLSSEVFIARTPADKIEIFRNTTSPSRPFVEVAQVNIHPKGLPMSTKHTKIDATLEKLKTHAATLGADAIMGVSIYVAPAGTVGHGGVSIDGIAIRWK